MIEGRPSKTAERVAVQRAAHQLRDTPRVFDDPLATRIIGEDALASLRAGTHPVEHSRTASALRAFLVVRSRFAEDALARAIERGVRQYVILGAGLDTFAYRHASAGEAIGLRVFEVDHPSTQAWKRSRLADTGIVIPASLTFAPVDFERDDLVDALWRAGLDRERPAFFAWLGVTPYLDREAIASTLRSVVRAVPDASVVFDYARTPSPSNPRESKIFQAMAERVAAIGEPWRTTFLVEDLGRALTASGFREIEDHGGDELNARYLAHRDDDLRVAGVGRLVHART